MTDKTEKIGIGSDHAGFGTKEVLKEMLINEMGLDINDFGTYSYDSVDYPDYAHKVGSSVNDGLIKRAILLCGSGNGVNMTANKYPKVRSALCWNKEIAKLARLHNDANILALPARFISNDEAKEIVKIFLNTGFEGGRHTSRICKIQV